METKMISIDFLTDEQIADVVDSLRDSVEADEHGAEYYHSIDDHSTAESIEKDAAYLGKLADDIENGLRIVGPGQASDIFDALTRSMENCAELELDEAYDGYVNARAAINEACMLAQF
jgi:hypothetical protein